MTTAVLKADSFWLLRQSTRLLIT